MHPLGSAKNGSMMFRRLTDKCTSGEWHFKKAFLFSVVKKVKGVMGSVI